MISKNSLEKLLNNSYYYINECLDELRKIIYLEDLSRLMKVYKRFNNL